MTLKKYLIEFTRDRENNENVYWYVMEAERPEDIEYTAKVWGCTIVTIKEV